MTTTFNDKAGIERLRQTREAKMQEIIPRLWLGSRDAADDKLLLATHGITHILTVMRTFVNELDTLSTQTSSKTCKFYNSATGISRLVVPVDDLPTENLLQHFPHSTEFILSGIRSGGTVLVHCLAGASRSPSVVAAFLMEVYRLSPAEAVAKIRESRPLVRPIVGFMDQLHVYAACDYRPLNQPVYAHWRLRAECETEAFYPSQPSPTLADSQIPHRHKVLAKIPLKIPYVVTEPPYIECTNCQKLLAPHTSVLPRDDESDNFYLAQPMDWMSPEFDNREHDGCLVCSQCENVVGEYNWNGMRNVSEQWISPAFVLYKHTVPLAEGRDIGEGDLVKGFVADASDTGPDKNNGGGNIGGKTIQSEENWVLKE